MRLNPSFYKYFFVALAGLIIDFGTLVFVKEVLGLNYLFAACAGFYGWADCQLSTKQ
jgi:putative flippase GtrA